MVGSTCTLTRPTKFNVAFCVAIDVNLRWMFFLLHCLYRLEVYCWCDKVQSPRVTHTVPVASTPSMIQTASGTRVWVDSFIQLTLCLMARSPCRSKSNQLCLGLGIPGGFHQPNASNIRAKRDAGVTKHCVLTDD